MKISQSRLDSVNEKLIEHTVYYGETAGFYYFGHNTQRDPYKPRIDAQIIFNKGDGDQWRLEVWETGDSPHESDFGSFEWAALFAVAYLNRGVLHKQEVLAREHKKAV